MALLVSQQDDLVSLFVLFGANKAEANVCSIQNLACQAPSEVMHKIKQRFHQPWLHDALSLFAVVGEAQRLRPLHLLEKEPSSHPAGRQTPPGGP